MISGSPSATKMIHSACPFTKTSSCRWWLLLLAVCLSADVATARSRKCLCWSQVHTVRCVGCSRLPSDLPAGVLRLNMTSNHVTRVHFTTKVAPALADLTSIYLTNNNIEALRYGDLSAFQSLMVLDLSANNLVTIDTRSIASNKHLKRLVLDGNPQIQMVAIYSQSLEHLYLQNCGLTSFDKRWLRHLPKLRGLYIRGNDKLSCEQVIREVHQDWPLLKVYCDAETTVTKTISEVTTVATASPETTSPNHPDTRDPVVVPNVIFWDVPTESIPPQSPDTVPQKIQLVVPIPVVPLIVILAVVLIALLFRFCRRPGKSGDRRLLEEPC